MTRWRWRTLTGQWRAGPPRFPCWLRPALRLPSQLPRSASRRGRPRPGTSGPLSTPAPRLRGLTSGLDASPCRAVGVYVGGVNRGTRQPAGTHPDVDGSGHRSRMALLPVYKGLQPPCGGRSRTRRSSRPRPPARARRPRTTRPPGARRSGMLHGSAFYNDIENYSATDAACRTAVLTYLSGWTRELHRLGYISGVYANLSSGAPQAVRGLHVSLLRPPGRLVDSPVRRKPGPDWLGGTPASNGGRPPAGQAVLGRP